IGGACGLTEPMKKKATALISLSPLTFTHQLTRVILLEQIYRALEIRRDSPYHR
ncbi:MAG: 23S rRNA (pseudouridine(1915)-N(3))-methyltransferase RlmH, partial [Simkania sp.]|nr:23S rRNA (pseudouridine(1915)-N(3))-methyltransferase RlmH [Simkania sp.]